MPLPNEQYTEPIFSQSTAYISDPALGCVQTFALQMADDPNAPVPDYYDFDPATGALLLENRPYELVDDRLVITIYSTDNVANRILTQYSYPHVQTTAPITVRTICGPQSTVVGAPDLPSRTALANANFGSLAVTDLFTSSNYRCPIIASSFLFTYG